MPTARIPLVGSFSQRGLAGNAALVLSEDQRFLNCTFDVITNPITGKSIVFLEKRPGWGQDSVVSTGLASTGFIKPQSFTSPLSAFGETNSAVYHGTINVGNITGRALHFTETLISNVGTVAIKSSDHTAWYYVNGAKDQLSYTGHTSSGNATVSTIASITGFYPGQLITGNTIGAGARVQTINSATSTITLDVNSTGTSTGTLLTKEPIAKIQSANYVSTGVYVSAFAALDGYLFYATDDGYVNNSDLNTVTSYPANGRLAVQQSPDPAIGVAVQKEILIVFGLNSNQKFQDAGYSTGSPLQVSKTNVDHIGALDQRSITSIEDDIYFASTPFEGDVGVYRIRNLQATRVSNPHIDRILGTIAFGGSVYAESFRVGGYPYAAFIASLASDGPSSNLLLESGDALLLEDGSHILLEDNAAQSASFIRMLVYNVGLNIWAEWDCNQATFIEGISSGTGNQILATSRMNTSGKIYRISPVSDGQLYQDDGVAFSCQVRTARLDFGSNKKKFVEEIKLICDKQSAGTATLEYSDDDYGSWTTAGTFDLTNMEPKITRCGSHYGGRAYRLTHSYNGPFRAEALEFRYSVAP